MNDWTKESRWKEQERWLDREVKAAHVLAITTFAIFAMAATLHVGLYLFDK